MTDSLKEIGKYRDFILFMELLALLHDVGKYYEEVKKKSGKRSLRPPAYHNTIGAFILGIERLKNKDVVIEKNNKILMSNGENYAPIDLSSIPFRISSRIFNESFNFFEEIIPDIWKTEEFLNETIGEFLICHHEHYGYKSLRAKTTPQKLLSKADSLDSAEDREGALDRKNRLKRGDFLNTPFGILDKIEYRFKDEENILNRIASALEEKNFNKIFSKGNYVTLKNEIQKVWYARPADTRPPFNDTTLWNHAYMVSSIFKSTVAITLLKREIIGPGKIASNLGILSVQSPNRHFLTMVNRLPDYNGRWEVFKEIRRQVRHIIEFEVPLGNLVYEDINGQYFLIPYLEFREAKGPDYSEIRDRIVEIYQEKTDGLLLPRIKIEKCEIKGKILQIGKTIIKLKKEYESNIDGMIGWYYFDEDFRKPKWIEEWKGMEEREICQVCFKMPAEKQHFIYHDRICKWCQQRRESPAKEEEAKFLDEVMDKDQRFALLVGQIGLLDQWLKGDYICTTFVNKETGLTKSPSPSRMMRIYQEIDRFDKNIISSIKKNFQLKRLKFRIDYCDPTGRKTKKDLAYKIYRHRLEKKWLKEVVKEYLIEKGCLNSDILNNTAGKIFSAITYNGKSPHLDLFIRNTTAETITDYASISDDKAAWPATEVVKRYLEKFKDMINFEFKTDIGEILRLKITDLKQFNEEGFVNGIKTVSKIKSIYSFSGEFMYLVPANEALNIANKLRDDFNRRYYKVQGRLCLNLGIIYADHKYPLYMVLDAGKRMLKEFQVANGLETEKKFAMTGNTEAYGIPALYKKENSRILVDFKEGVFKGEVQLINIDSRVVKLKVGKGREIDDKFYPYFLQKINGQVKPVYIGKIPFGCEIIFSPGVFDFEYLNSSRVRMNLTLKKQYGQWRKRDSLFPLIHTRPYQIWKIENIINAGRQLRDARPSTTALENFRELLAREIYDWFKNKEDFPQSEDKELVKSLAQVLITTMEGLKKEVSATLLNFSKNLEIFDLLELALFLNAFDFS